MVLLFAGCANQNAPVQGLNYAKADSDYLALKQTIINQVAEPDTFDRILNIYSLTSYYQPAEDTEKAGMLLSEQYLESGQYRACIEVAQKMLDVNYTSLTAHYAMSECASRSGQESLARFHTFVLDSFIEAIWRTGNGQSPASAFIINSANDLYAFIRLHEFVAVGQDLSYLSGVPIQEISILMPETNKQFKWYFNVTPQFRRAAIDEFEAR